MEMQQTNDQKPDPENEAEKKQMEDVQKEAAKERKEEGGYQ
ncbi:hypothetical protein FHS96_005653 [Sphingomonas zeicaulis]